MRSFVRRLSTFGAGAALASIAVAAQPAAHVYTTADGLASDTVFRVVPDGRGFLWFATSDGLTRFDGYDFVTFSSRDGLRGQPVSDVAETRGGTIWVSTAAGLFRADPGRAEAPLFVAQNLAGVSTDTAVGALLETRDGALWATTGSALHRFDRPAEEAGPAPSWRATRFEIAGARDLSVLAEDPLGGLWIGDVEALFHFSPESGIERHPLPGVSPGSVVFRIHAERDGTLWVGTAWSIYRAPPRRSAGEPPAFERVNDRGIRGWGNGFFEPAEGGFQVATSEGLFRSDTTPPDRFTRLDDLDRVCDRALWDIAEGRDGDLWIASSCGAVRIERRGFETYGVADGLTSQRINTIFESRAGELMVMTNDRTLHRFDGRRFAAVASAMPEQPYRGWGWGQCALQARDDSWWIASGYALWHFPPSAQPEPALSRKPEAIVFSREPFRIFEDSRGAIWLSLTGSPALLRREIGEEGMTDITAETGVAAEYISFAESPDGAVWIGTSAGVLLRFRGGQWERFGAAEGVPAGWLRDLHLDDSDRLWIASSAGGLARIDDTAAARPRFEHITVSEGLTSDSVWSLVGDREGRIYATTARGVDRIDPRTGRIRRFTAADGLIRGQAQSSFRDRNGALWFGTEFGLMRTLPESERRRQPPRTLLTALRVAGVARPVSALGIAALADVELAAGENALDVDFVGLGARLGEPLRYEMRLEGGDDAWSAPFSGRSITLAGLAPGRYRLDVRAVDADGVASPEPATVAFTVAAPFWRRGWFLAAAAAAVALALLAAHRARLRRLLEIERVRMRIATDLHDDIGANLSRIAVLSEAARGSAAHPAAEGSDASLASIAEISRESVSSMSDIVWAIHPRRDGLDDLVSRMRRFAGEAYGARGIELEFRGPEPGSGKKLHHELRRELFLVFKECVTNAVRHSGARHARVEIGIESGRLRLAIDDDGRGFDPGAVHEGNGVASVRRRVAAIGGKLALDSKPGSGTRVAIDAPLGGSPARQARARPVQKDS